MLCKRPAGRSSRRRWRLARNVFGLAEPIVYTTCFADGMDGWPRVVVGPSVLFRTEGQASQLLDLFSRAGQSDESKESCGSKQGDKGNIGVGAHLSGRPRLSI